MVCGLSLIRFLRNQREAQRSLEHSSLPATALNHGVAQLFPNKGRDCLRLPTGKVDGQ